MPNYKTLYNQHMRDLQKYFKKYVFHLFFYNKKIRIAAQHIIHTIHVLCAHNTQILKLDLAIIDVF